MTNRIRPQYLEEMLTGIVGPDRAAHALDRIAVPAMVDRLRGDEGSIGLVTANGGYLTKHAMGVYSTTPPAQPWRHARPQAEVDALPCRELAEVVDGPVTVEAAVAMFDREGAPERAVVAALLEDGRRAWGGTSHPDDLAQITSVETAGAPAYLGPDGELRLV